MMIDFFVEWGYWGLFALSFLSATILPIGSEVLFISLIFLGFDLKLLILVATIGNSLGGATTYYVGTLGKIEWVEKYFKIKATKIEKMRAFLSYKGALMGFFAFLPFVGDIIVVSLGFMRANFVVVFISMTVGRLLRYIIVGVGSEKILCFFFN